MLTSKKKISFTYTKKVQHPSSPPKKKKIGFFRDDRNIQYICFLPAFWAQIKEQDLFACSELCRTRFILPCFAGCRPFSSQDRKRSMSSSMEMKARGVKGEKNTLLCSYCWTTGTLKFAKDLPEGTLVREEWYQSVQILAVTPLLRGSWYTCETLLGITASV